MEFRNFSIKQKIPRQVTKVKSPPPCLLAFNTIPDTSHKSNKNFFSLVATVLCNYKGQNFGLMNTMAQNWRKADARSVNQIYDVWQRCVLLGITGRSHTTSLEDDHWKTWWSQWKRPHHLSPAHVNIQGLVFPGQYCTSPPEGAGALS